ncbi:MAG: DUF4402 domain-containing protein [Desulfovibrionaceae bacterium]|jgi:hypothetical protein|nr:DUF4402 domain-containing protein [Desulfovibrionaceae bacterium]
MKKLSKILAVVVCLSVLGTFGVANAGTRTAAMDVSAEVIDLVSAVTTTGLNFGSLIPITGGNATLDCSAGFSNALAEDGVTITTSTAPVAGVITVTAAAAGNVTITATNSTQIRTGALGSPSMTVDWISDNSQLGARVVAAGANDFYVGGRLNVGATQEAGTYTGTLTVTVTY